MKQIFASLAGGAIMTLLMLGIFAVTILLSSSKDVLNILEFKLVGAGWVLGEYNAVESVTTRTRKCQSEISAYWTTVEGGAIQPVVKTTGGYADVTAIPETRQYEHLAPASYIDGRPLEGIICLQLYVKPQCIGDWDRYFINESVSPKACGEVIIKE